MRFLYKASCKPTAQFLWLLAVFLFFSNTAFASPGGAVVQGFGKALTGPEQKCYGVSMVGYDSVINSRLGVPAEHALELARMQVSKVSKEGEELYAPFLLKVILDAYLWYETPHTYAVKVMYNCAIDSVQMRTASALE